MCRPASQRQRRVDTRAAMITAKTAQFAGQRVHVLISEPNAEVNLPYLPYMWAVLKTYYEQNGAHVDAMRWFEPPYLRRSAAESLAPYDGERIDVLGLSCYTWNWELQIEIAQRVKARCPECLIVAGGPHPDYKDPEFFAKNPLLDAVVVKDGEIPFTRLLDQLAEGQVDLPAIPGLCLPSQNRAPLLTLGSVQLTAPAEVPKEFNVSPYAAQAEYYDRQVASLGAGKFGALWELSRGCPYSCSFCDWGSMTMSKIRAFSNDRLGVEGRWLFKSQPMFVFLVDANFGMLPRDVEFSRQLAVIKKETGYQGNLVLSSAKNNPERTIEIAQIFYEAGLIEGHALAIQHTNPHVLACASRENISTAKMMEAIRVLKSKGIPTEVQLIVGIPGDTRALWRSCLTDLMEWGVHDDYFVHPYSLLPNAPAGDREFMKRWQVQAIESWNCSTTGNTRVRGSLEGTIKSPIIVSTRTFDRDDWIDMRTYAVMMKALHNRSLTRLLSMYLRFSHDVTYSEFYNFVVDQFLPQSSFAAVLETVRNVYRSLLSDPEDTLEEILVPVGPDTDLCLEPSQWIFLKICQEHEQFYAELARALADRFRFVERLPAAVDYQHQMLILPTYDRRQGKTFSVNYDWPAYFARAQAHNGFRRLPEPRPTPGAQVRATDQFSYVRSTHPMDWIDAEGQDRFSRFIQALVTCRVTGPRNNFQQIEILESGQSAGKPLLVLAGE